MPRLGPGFLSARRATKRAILLDRSRYKYQYTRCTCVSIYRVRNKSRCPTTETRLVERRTGFPFHGVNCPWGGGEGRKKKLSPVSIQH